MNNIFVGQNDPLLTNIPTYRMADQQVNPQVLFNHLYTSTQKDWVGELDDVTKKLDVDVIEALSNNSEYIKLSSALQTSIQSEIMGFVKGNLNINPSVINNIKRQMEIIENVKSEKNAESKQNLSELNDYMKNYSHLTFDEYKKIKDNEKDNETKENKTKKKNK